MRKKRIFIFFFLLLAGLVFLSIYCCDKIISNAAKGKLYTDASVIPYNKVGLLLGTSKYTAEKNHNPYYDYRIEAARTLIKAGKIKYLVISGDNSRKDYNEPAQMKADLVKEGVDSTFIYLDYAGFRTFDSMVRLKEIFGQDSVTLISQPFHNERAIYIAGEENIAAIGFNASDAGISTFRVLQREKLARVKVFLDYLFGKKPKFLGQRISIP